MFATGMVNARLATPGKSLVIPQSSVLWTGTRSVVYVKIPDAKEPTFVMQGNNPGTCFEQQLCCSNGLMEGEEIVTNGTFSVDASAQLEGKPSMMNPEAEKPIQCPE